MTKPFFDRRVEKRSLSGAKPRLFKEVYRKMAKSDGKFIFFSFLKQVKKRIAQSPKNICENLKIFYPLKINDLNFELILNMFIGKNIYMFFGDFNLFNILSK